MQRSRKIRMVTLCLGALIFSLIFPVACDSFNTPLSPLIKANLKVANKSLYNYTITFDSQGGSAVAAQTVTSGGTITAPTAPNWLGYIFGGWYREAAYTTAWNFTSDTVTADITLYAKWTPDTTLYTYAVSVPGSPVNGISLNAVNFSPASPQLAGTSVTATLGFYGTVTAAGTFVINLTSAKAGLSGVARIQVKEAGVIVPTPETFTFTVPAQNIDDFVLTFTTHNPSIENNLGTTGATDTFNAVHTYLSTKTAAQLASEGLIQLGDYIDLPSLTVDGTSVSNDPIAPSPIPFPGYEGKFLRLIVVGINSFKAGGPYAGGGMGSDAAHLVFQFQNLPFRRQMETSDTNAYGYGGSAMKTYLIDKFLPGLIAAGVPDSVLWAPTRYVANKGNGATGVHTITDKLWLPTEREVFGGFQTYPVFYSDPTYETTANQAWLQYYTNGTRLYKFESGLSSPNTFWLASPRNASDTIFLAANGGISPSFTASNVNLGVAPAFCVK